MASLYLCSLAINLNFYVHLHGPFNSKRTDKIYYNGRRWSTLLVLRQKSDLAIVREE